jgi:fatty-acyl-CoA synthase
MPFSVSYLFELVFARARLRPNDRAFVYLEDDGPTRTLRAGELARDAAAFARAVDSAGLKPGDLVLLVFPQSLDLVTAFWGTMTSGAVPAVFPFLSPKLDPRLYRERVAASAAHSGARAVITTADFKAELAGLIRDPGCRVLSRHEVLAAPGGRAPEPDSIPPSLTPDDPAFLLHTSGSSGIPKGVMFSHRMVLYHIRSMAKAFGMRDDDVIVSWLPLHHDMGLYLGLILPAFEGVPAVLMSPFRWIGSPKSLLWAIHEHRGTVVWMPNFAFNHCAAGIRARDLEGLDLSSWRSLGNSSEPVHKSSLDVFARRFGPYGFPETKLASAYGLTEQGLVTVSPLGRAPKVDWVRVRDLQEAGRAVPAGAEAPGAMPAVSSGVPVEGAEVLIVDEAGRTVPERILGEIILRSPFTIREYHHLPELTAQVIRDGWFHTGDSGYFADGELYVCGRLKDVIISGGKNIYPQDLEAVADAIPGLRPGRSVAFGLADEQAGTEGIIMACELREPVDEDKALAIERELRRRVTRELDVTLARVELIAERGWVVKTAGGKVARAANRAKYLERITTPADPAKTKAGGKE